MQQRDSGLMCRFRRLPKPLGYSLLAVGVAAPVSALGIPAMAAVSTDRPAAVASAARMHDPAPARLVPATRARKKTPVQTFFDAGYHYADAALLSHLWAVKTPYDAKVRAGNKLLAGGVVPTRPGQTAWTVDDSVALEAYFANGHDYDDAVQLARRWRVASASGLIGEVKTLGGRNVLAGLPVATAPRDRQHLPTTAQLTGAFFDAGYDYADAVLLSRLWANDTTPYQAKLEAGYLLREGRPVPSKPDQTAWNVSREAAAEAFLNNGHDYQDAQRLGRTWQLADPYDAKVTAGRKILAGLRLPLGR